MRWSTSFSCGHRRIPFGPVSWGQKRECYEFMSDPEVGRISIIRAPKNEPISDSCMYFGMIQKMPSVKT